MEGPSQQICDELVYVPGQRILICIECQYAVQPQALSTHLKKHKIFRGKRQSILQQCNDLSLLDPQNCERTLGPCDAIQELPVFQGYKCLSRACAFLCTSEKRMSQHWSTVHECHSRAQIRFRKALVQTLFRGVYTQFCEVNDVGGGSSLRRRLVSSDSELPCSTTRPKAPDESPSILEDDVSVSPVEPSDYVQTLMYMHHYTIATASTMTLGVDSAAYWIQRVPEMAAHHACILSGILGLSACHKACLAENAMGRERHRKAAVHHLSETSFHLRAELGSGISVSNAHAVSATARLIGVQSNVLSRFDLDDLYSSGAIITPSIATDALRNHLSLLRGSAEVVLQATGFLCKNGELDLLPLGMALHSTMNKDNACSDSGRVPQSSCNADEQLPRVAFLQGIRAVLSVLVAEAQLDADEIAVIERCVSTITDLARQLLCVDGSAGPAAWVAAMVWAASDFVSHEVLPGLSEGAPVAFIVMAFYGLSLQRAVTEDVSASWFITGDQDRLLDLCEAALSTTLRHANIIRFLRDGFGTAPRGAN